MIIRKGMNGPFKEGKRKGSQVKRQKPEAGGKPWKRGGDYG
jgi:hypothetical protein